ncbi:PLD nuclease N-terminal domain-containing protein [Kibdelosporangium philippinense]|uniref:PLD nuclease N-terminal domain-containing protein n=1 Tax=Kibdelosporangium philippinense TaxID=211113 RepID=A0ABS8Z9R3_9PSEU|nr:PLD nuclease N-terminal domain-containing protein [Kibdelosporangium philippinense]MCE7004621.1 PLD nuclease N-terminal domain-containing protein [Kibdelosporangium philippinense]
MADKKWRDLTSQQRRLAITTAAVQGGLALTAWYDLSRRPRESVNGPKLMWALAIAVNFVGPIAYFRFGRRRPVPHKATPWHEKVHLDASKSIR